MTADINTPLVRRSDRISAWQRLTGKLPLKPIGLAAAGLVPLALLGWVVVVDDPLGGEPRAIAAIAEPPRAGEPQPAAGGGAVARAPVGAPAQPASAPAGNEQVVRVIDGSTGEAREVVIQRGADPRGTPQVRQVEQPAVPSGTDAAGGDPRLLEQSRHGPVPKVGPDGARPADVYARTAALPAGRTDGPRLALIVGGLGVSATATSEAITKLPAGVTLGFVPYGADLGRAASRARADGHEIIVQVPMEPPDYPNNDPGPQSLLTSLSPEQNVDRLLWAMSRLQGFVAVANFMGGRFVASEAALTPVLREVNRRGLLFLDDGTSSRSVVREAGAAVQAPVTRADIVVDAVPSAAEIDSALATLEQVARDRGRAVGYAQASPLVIERIAAFARALEARGVTLVPLTAVAQQPARRS